MCLSKVYLKKRGERDLIIEEASQVIENNGMLEVNTIFGDEKKLKGYSIGEVNLIENYVILKKK